MAWRIESECVLCHPVSGRHIFGKRVYDDADFLVAEIYLAEEADVAKMVAADEVQAALKNILTRQLCECDADVDKETGSEPPVGSETTFWGDPVWGGRCDYCKARAALAKAEGR